MPRKMSIPNTLVDQTTITAGAHNTNYTDIASEISNSVAVDGQSQMSGQFKFASGTVGAPGLVPGSDLDTGVYRIGGDNLGVSCAGAKVLDIGTAGFGVTGTLSATGAITENGAAVYKAGGTDVAVADGGTGQSTATAGFDALAPTTTRGDIIARRPEIRTAISPSPYSVICLDAASQVPGGRANGHRFVMAMQFGGCTDAEAYELMRDRFCAHHGSDIELWDVDDLPRDRWFRDAWVRSHNGGPINISLPKAKGVQFRKIKQAAARENTRRLEEIDLFDCTIDPDWGAIRNAIRGADDVGELRHVWPSDLPPLGPSSFSAQGAA